MMGLAQRIFFYEQNEALIKKPGLIDISTFVAYFSRFMRGNHAHMSI